LKFTQPLDVKKIANPLTLKCDHSMYNGMAWMQYSCFCLIFYLCNNVWQSRMDEIHPHSSTFILAHLLLNSHPLQICTWRIYVFCPYILFNGCYKIFIFHSLQHWMLVW
jgi:hypothetical protein